MRNIFTVVVIILFSSSLFAQTESQPMLLGKITRTDLTKSPYNEWFNREYIGYEVNQEVLKKLKDNNLKDYTVTIFLGTWCADSHREVPRLMKVLEQAGLSSDKTGLIAVNTGDGVHKQSPTGEDKGKYIFKVPTFIISKNGKEVNRIVEYPVVSLERDLVTILSDAAFSQGSYSKIVFDLTSYSPNYRSYPYIIDWLENGVLADKNVSIKGLADHVRHLTKNAGELTSAGYVMMNQGRTQEAVALYKIAYLLYPDALNYYGYIETLYKNGEQEAAMDMLIKYLSKSTDKQNIEWALELYDKIKQK